MCNKDLLLMKTSYGHLFEIEFTIRRKVIQILENSYGPNPLHKIKFTFKNKLSNKSIENMAFHELLSFLKMVPVLYDAFGETIISDLMRLIHIRNKIAHCNLIDDKEYEMLSRIYHEFEVWRY